MERIIRNLKKPEIESAGALRILGRAYYKLPGLLSGSNKKALAYLNKANTMTINPEVGVSSNPTNVVYLAEVMIAEDQMSSAKDLLTKFVTFTLFSLIHQLINTEYFSKIIFEFSFF